MEAFIESVEVSIKKVLVFLEDEYKKMRADRANPSILDKVKIDYYGASTPIGQVAAISLSEARVLIVSPWDLTVLNAIEKAISKADIGVSPQNDGKIIRLAFPPLSQERREELSKEASKMAEDAKISIRNIRHDALNKLKSLKKNSEITQDEQNRMEKKIQSLIESYTSKVEKSKEEKIKQIVSG